MKNLYLIFLILIASATQASVRVFDSVDTITANN